MTEVEFGPCCFCGLSIRGTNIDPCRVQVSTVSDKWQVWVCHAECFKQRLAVTQDTPGLLDPAHF